MSIGTLDIIFGVIVFVAIIRCIYRGFIAEMLSVAALLLGIAAAVLFARPLSKLLETYTDIESASVVIAFLALFLLVYIIVKISEGLIHRLFETLHLERLDRALGLFLGIIEGVLLCACVVFILSAQPFINVDGLLETSIFVDFILRLFPGNAIFLTPEEVLHV